MTRKLHYHGTDLDIIAYSRAPRGGTVLLMWPLVISPSILCKKKKEKYFVLQTELGTGQKEPRMDFPGHS